MSKRHGFTVQVYIDARILADLVEALNAQENLPPRTLSALVRQLLTELRDKYVKEELRVTDLAGALDILESYGFSTKQTTKSREHSLISKLSGEAEKIEAQPSTIEQLEAKAFLKGMDSLTKDEQKLMEEYRAKE